MTTARATCCCCCGWTTRETTRVDTGPIHFKCWDEHHSDPTGVWAGQTRHGANAVPNNGTEQDL